MGVSQTGPLTCPALNAATRLCAVFGSPIRHSASPAMHNAAFTELGLNWRYLAFEVAPEQLREAIAGAQAMRFAGLNLTVPHKLLAVPLVDVLDESARIWGAVNTIRIEGRHPGGPWLPLRMFENETPAELRSHGFNTDAEGLVISLEQDLAVTLREASVLLLGAGGAGRTAALKLAESGVAELFLVNRTRSKTEEVAAEIRRRWPHVRVTVGYPPTTTSVDLLLNATSLGLKATDASPLDAGAFALKQAAAVYDMIYKPAETPLLAAARAAGCRTANGLGMLVWQGARAFEIWTGAANVPVTTMRKAAEYSIYAS